MDKKSNNSQFSHYGYIFSMMGSAIGFANILSFSARCYKNGGGAFLIPFIVAMAVVGLPMLYLEGIVGQRFTLPVVSAYGKAAGKIGKFFGWLSVIACATIGAFYTVLTGWSLAYTGFAAMDMIPQDSASFFLNDFLKVSSGLTDFGSFSPLIFIVTAAITTLTWFILVRNIQEGIETVCSIFMPALAFLISIFAISVCFLPGASIGFSYFLQPDFSKLADFTLWREVFGHVFFSFSLGLGIVVGYSRYTNQSINIPRAMICVALGDFFISFIAGLTIFGCVGFMSHCSGIPFTEIVTSDSTFEMGFVIFPMVLKCFSPVAAMVIGTLFFFSVFIAGITGVFSIVESIAGNIQVEFAQSRKAAVGIATSVIALFSAIFCMGNSTHLIGALEPMVLGNNMLIGGIAEIAIFMYTTKLIRDHKIWFHNDKRTWAFYSIISIVPLILTTILIGSLVTEVQSGIDTPCLVRWGWLAIACLVSIALAQNSKKRQSVNMVESPEIFTVDDEIADSREAS
ncbi:MAG: NSS family neurotransmitter:Na+ symporter [Chlamydiales bacterium]|jgi:NSS family neurotransmitter:Na+ symporter